MLFFKSRAFIDDAVTKMTGTAGQKRVPTAYFRTVAFPLPPFDEQERIVAKVEELFAQTERLAAQLAAAEEARRRLHTAAAQRLTAPTRGKDGVRAAWELLAEQFDALYTAPETIEALKQAILQLAVQGRLVRQDPHDEPASELLKRIAAAKARLVEEGKIRAEKPLPPVREEEMPYEVPAGWAWVRMGDITDIVSGVAKGRNLSRHKTIVLPYLRVANVQRGYLDLETIKEIVAKEEELERYRLQEGDLLLTEGGDADKLGRSAIWRGEIADCIHQNHIFRARPYGEELHAEWLQLCTNSQYGRNYFFGASKQTTNLASINMRQLRYFPIALPPQREQQHIIGKLLEMYTLCDQIIGQTTAAEQARERLLAAVLAGARNGVP